MLLIFHIKRVECTSSFCRLARLRIYHGHFVEPCKYVFEILLGAAANMSKAQNPRDLSIIMWSIAKISGLETLEARAFLPPKTGETIP